MKTLHLRIKYEPRYAYHAFGKVMTVEFRNFVTLFKYIKKERKKKERLSDRQQRYFKYRATNQHDIRMYNII